MIGVYCLKHKGNIVYIGSSSRNVMQRKSYHLREIRNKTHKNKYLRNLENVTFEVLEYTELDQCRLRETYYLKLYNPVANKQKKANGHFTIDSKNYKKSAKKTWSKYETRKKASHSAKLRWKNMPEDEKKRHIKNLDKHRHLNKKIHIKICKTILADAKKKKIIRDDGIIFDSVKEAAEYTGIKANAISNCLNGRCNKTGGFAWKYA